MINFTPSRCQIYSTQCDKTCQWLTGIRWFSSFTPIFSTNTTDGHSNWSIVESGDIIGRGLCVAKPHLVTAYVICEVS